MLACLLVLACLLSGLDDSAVVGALVGMGGAALPGGSVLERSLVGGG